MKHTRLIRAGYVAAGVVAVLAAWSAHEYWRYHYAAIHFPKIDRHREPAVRRILLPPTLLTNFNPTKARPFDFDLRGQDLSGLDLRRFGPRLRHAVFDQGTRWPAAEKMPLTADFDARLILELGRNPGLGVRQLHTQGVTGRGVGIAVVDSLLPTGHPEYADRLRLYEELGDIYWPDTGVDSFRGTGLHGPAVVSIAAGKTLGVAPAADIYYIATFGGHSWLRRHINLFRHPGKDMHRLTDFAVIARAVRRILAVNRQLPPARKIRVLSMSLGWNPSSQGLAEITAATAEARAAGLLVICSSVRAIHGFEFHGLGREPTAHPDRFESYGPGLFWADGFGVEMPRERLLVPMDARTTAGFSADAAYVYYPRGGWSWAVPYIAGTYALACQVKPDVTPDEFWSAALKSGRTIEVQRDGRLLPLGPILDPVNLIRTLRSTAPDSGNLISASSPARR